MDRYATLRQGLIGAWCPSLRDTGYLLRDRSGLNRHGTLTNMGGQVNWVAGSGGMAVSTDGINDRVNVTFPVTLVDFTLCGWALVRTLGRGHFLFSVERAAIGNFLATIFINDTNFLVAQFFDGSANPGIGTSTALSADRWYHFCLTRQRNASGTNQTARLFLDGVSQATNTGENTTQNLVATDLTIGGQRYISSRTAHCLFDDVRIYNRALTLQEIRLLASQRGIGLLPTRHRRGSLLSQFWLNVAGTWKTAKPWINVGGTWKQGSPKIRAGGAWKG